MDAIKVGGTWVSFVEGLSREDKQDVQDCLLYAELRANSEGIEGFVWLSHYQSTLLTLGFNLQSYIVDRPILVLDIRQVEEYAVEVSGVQSTQRLAQSLGDVFDAMPIRQDALSYLRHPVDNAQTRHYQCVPCEKTQEGHVIVFVCGLALSCQRARARGRTHDVYLNAKGGAFVLNRTIYARHRAQVQEAVHQAAAHMVSVIEI